MIEILGHENIATITLSDLINNRFKMAELNNKLANIADDIGYDRLRNAAQLKMLTGNSHINAEKKFKDPFKFKNYAKMIFSANEPPEFEETSDAIKKG
ncbi:MAG: DUF5906 domain-containing protein [Candidatus Methanosuratincola sp.]|jgi:putative DNA primase/helicase|nr:DUF5906 domain-containing protein [Candidatus Methanosuratincola sp.]